LGQLPTFCFRHRPRPFFSAFAPIVFVGACPTSLQARAEKKMLGDSWKNNMGRGAEKKMGVGEVTLP